MSDDQFQRRHRVLQDAGFPSSDRPDYRAAVGAHAPRPPRSTAMVPNCLALIATRNFLPFAQIAARGFLTHHPEFSAFLLLVDGEPEDAACFGEGRTVLLRDLDLPDAGWHTAKFTAAEFCQALKPVFLRYLAPIAERAVYLDCDSAVFSRLTELLDRMQASPLVLLPHRLTPRDGNDGRATPADVSAADLVTAACFGIRPADCGDFLSAWAAATLAPGAFGPGPGYRTDQQYLNTALVTLPTACLLRESRYNLGYWNLNERDFHLGDGGDSAVRFMVGDRPLGVFHFSGYDIGDRLNLARHDRRHAVYDLPAVAEILRWYSDNVLAAPAADLRHEPYGYDRLANGLTVTPLIRHLLKKYETWIPAFDPRTTAGADALCAFLMDPLPRAGSMLPLVAAETYDRRPDLQLEYPAMHTAMSVAPYWRWFCRHAGKEYGIELLVDRFRRCVMTGAAQDFADQVAAALGDRRFPLFFGIDRMAACQFLRLSGHDALAVALSEARMEVLVFTDLSAALEIYRHRPDLQTTFPDILDKHRDAFGDWLAQNAFAEHGCSDRVAEAFRRHGVGTSLARIFSYLARREDMPPHYQDSLLLDDPALVLHDLVRDAGEGLEYTLEDVVLLRFVHHVRRHLLVPLFLELPRLRQRGDASRTAEASIMMLPQAVRDTDWAMRGCEAHAASFDRFDAALDSAMRQWAENVATTPRDVLGVLQRQKPADDALSIVEPPYRVATALVSRDREAAAHLLATLKERTSCPGVNIFGYFKSDIGVGESARGLAGAVSLLRPVNRVPLHTMQVRDGVLLPEMFQQFDYLSDTNVFVSYPHQRDDYLGMMRPEQLAGRRNVAHLAWEQKGGNPWWAVVYDRYDEIWMISEFAATPFRRMFPGRVRVVPNVLDFERFPNNDAAADLRLKGETLTFLFAFDANSSMERKNPDAVIDAFVKAFQGTRHSDRVSLTVKIGGMHRPRHAARLERLMRRGRESGLAIHLDGRQLSREAMLRLIAGADCYVSLHHAEGFGYTMAEAMAYGVPVVASGYSGNLEYMTHENSYLVPCTETFVKQADGPFQRGSVWGEPDIDAAAALLRAVADNPTEAIAVGERGRQTVRSKLSAAAVAETIRPYFAAATAETMAAQ